MLSNKNEICFLSFLLHTHLLSSSELTWFFLLQIPSIKNPMEDSDLQPRLIMHHGMPMPCSVIAYDPLQHTLALATEYILLYAYPTFAFIM